MYRAPAIRLLDGPQDVLYGHFTRSRQVGVCVDSTLTQNLKTGGRQLPSNTLLLAVFGLIWALMLV